MASTNAVKKAFFVLVCTVFTMVMFRVLDITTSIKYKIKSLISETSGTDIHILDPIYGHTGELFSDRDDHVSMDMSNHIVIGCAITSRGRRLRKEKLVDIKKALPFFLQLYPTFCETASEGYHYPFYISYDQNDAFFSDPSGVNEFTKAFKSEKCEIRNATLSLHFVQCNHSGSPAWAQNDAMMEAYLDNMEYFYRVNDDSMLVSKNWTTAFISRLKQFDPPNVGVVGPKHSGGNTAILTYDFVHKSHIEIFGFYYPRVFTDWFADRWISDVYRKAGKFEKMSSVRLKHTMTSGTRYRVHQEKGKFLRSFVPEGALEIAKYVDAVRNNRTKGNDMNEVRVIAMSLFGKDQVDTYGAIRNCQLRRIYFPNWIIRIYMENPASAIKEAVPKRIIKTLQRLGAQIVYIDTIFSTVPVSLWSFLVMGDKRVHKFIIRRPKSRLSALDARLVNAWLSSGKVVHCIKDHPVHGKLPMLEYLWGAWNTEIRRIFGASMPQVLLENKEKSPAEFMSNIIWPKVKNFSVCHDSISCTFWNMSTLPMPVKERVGRSYIGQPFGPYGEPILLSGLVDELPSNSTDERCIAGE